MPLIFPDSPIVGQQTTGINNVVYEWDGQKWRSISLVDADKIVDGDTRAEVVDNGSDGQFRVLTENVERFVVDASGNTLVKGQKELRLADSDSSNYVGFKSPATVSGNVVWMLPSGEGTAEQVLATNGSGVLYWSEGGGASVTTSGSPPPSPAIGDLWFDTDEMRGYVYYNDGDSSQWVEMNPSWNGTVADGSITTAKIADSGITTIKIANGAVTPAKLSTGGPSWTASGNFIVDTNTFYVDATNDRVGIGTASPGALLDVNGNVGVGVPPNGTWGTAAIGLGKSGASNPTYPFIASPTSQDLWLGSNARWDGTNWKYQFSAASITAFAAQIGYNAFSVNRAVAGAAGSNITWLPALKIDDAGRVGIGATNLAAGLAVTTYGTQLVSDSTYYQPAGRHFIHLGGVQSGTHNWVGFSGQYAGSSGSCNILLQPNFNDVGQGAGAYIGGEATGVAATALTFGHMVSAGSVSGNATKLERMKIDSSGRVTTPYQPMFSAYRSANQSITANTATKVSLDATEFNVGNHFDTATSRFNVPVTGVYLFTGAIQYGANGAPHVNFYKNGLTSVDGWVDFGSGAQSATQSRAMYLVVGDWIELYGYHASNTTMNANRTRMTGFLIG